MSEQFQRQPTISELQETEAIAPRPAGYTRRFGEPFFTKGDFLALVVIVAMIWGPLAMGAIRS